MFADTDWGSSRGSTRGSCWDWPPLVSHLSPTWLPSRRGARLEPQNWLELGVGATSSPGWEEWLEEIVSARPKRKIRKRKRAERNLLGLSSKKWIWVFHWQYLCDYKWWPCALVQCKSTVEVSWKPSILHVQDDPWPIVSEVEHYFMTSFSLTLFDYFYKRFMRHTIY